MKLLKEQYTISDELRDFISNHKDLMEESPEIILKYLVDHADEYKIKIREMYELLIKAGAMQYKPKDEEIKLLSIIADLKIHHIKRDWQGYYGVRMTQIPYMYASGENPDRMVQLIINYFQNDPKYVVAPLPSEYAYDDGSEEMVICHKSDFTTVEDYIIDNGLEADNEGNI